MPAAMIIGPMARRRLAPSDVFINFPFDARYERLFMALVAGLVGLGDLSRVQLSRRRDSVFRVPRFNMPFELGLAVAVARGDAARQWIVMEALPHRLGHSCSDLDGYGPVVHGNRVKGVIRALLNAFSSLSKAPLHDEDALLWVYRRLAQFRRQSLPTGIYDAHPFKQLVVVAKALVNERVLVSRY